MDLTSELKSGGSVLVPVRRFTRNAFQFEYLCCMPAGQITPPSAAITSSCPTRHSSYSLLGGTRGLLLEAHHPTGCTSGMQRLHQKSLLLSPSKPSYRKRALKPAKHKIQTMTADCCLMTVSLMHFDLFDQIWYLAVKISSF